MQEANLAQEKLITDIFSQSAHCVFIGYNKELTSPSFVSTGPHQPSPDYIAAPETEQDQPARHDFISAG